MGDMRPAETLPWWVKEHMARDGYDVTHVSHWETMDDYVLVWSKTGCCIQYDWDG